MLLLLRETVGRLGCDGLLTRQDLAGDLNGSGGGGDVEFDVVDEDEDEFGCRCDRSGDDC
jgi:hypothetical protein